MLANPPKIYDEIYDYMKLFKENSFYALLAIISKCKYEDKKDMCKEIYGKYLENCEDFCCDGNDNKNTNTLSNLNNLPCENNLLNEAAEKMRDVLESTDHLSLDYIVNSILEPANGLEDSKNFLNFSFYMKGYENIEKYMAEYFKNKNDGIFFDTIHFEAFYQIPPLGYIEKKGKKKIIYIMMTYLVTARTLTEMIAKVF